MVKHQNHMQHLLLPQHRPDRQPDYVNLGTRYVPAIYLFERKLLDNYLAFNKLRNN